GGTSPRRACSIPNGRSAGGRGRYTRRPAPIASDARLTASVGGVELLFSRTGAGSAGGAAAAGGEGNQDAGPECSVRQRSNQGRGASSCSPGCSCKALPDPSLDAATECSDLLRSCRVVGDKGNASGATRSVKESLSPLGVALAAGYGRLLS